MRRHDLLETRRRAWRAVAALLALSVAVPASLAGCDTNTDDMLKAKVVTSRNELIGGPAAKGKLGDFLIANDKIRFIITGQGPSYAAGSFGGTLVDGDLHRWRSDERNGAGWDAFSDTFPLVNLLASNPSAPKKDLLFGEDGIELVPSVADVSVLKDGADGEAIVRVEGNLGYMFETFKFFDRDFLEGLIDDMIVGPLSDPEASGGLLDLLPAQFQGLVTTILDRCDNNVFCVVHKILEFDLRGLLNRLQLSFDFTTDYILRPGERHLTLRTTVRANPPTERQLASCPPIECALTAADCPNGLAMKELTEEAGGLNLATNLCPICACAESKDSLATFNESLDFFRIMLGDLPYWKDPAWKGGVVAGDFLFFGSEASVFAPGIGFDYDMKIYGNLYQGVGTMGSPFAFDWIAGVGENVSYALTSVNPEERTGPACPTWEITVTRVDADQEEALATYLAESLPEPERYDPRLANIKVRNLIVDKTPVRVASLDWPDPGPNAEGRAAAFDSWYGGLLETEVATALLEAFGEDISLGLKRTHDCLPSQLLMPLFSTSATASFSHFTDGERFFEGEDGAYEDRVRAYTFERYFAVGEGDVGSLLRTLYELRGTPHGELSGVVYEEGSVRPVTKAGVFVLRTLPDESVPDTYAEYREEAMAAFGNPGLVSYMQSDVGTDPVEDGKYRGALEAGDFLVVAHAPDRGTSKPVAITMRAGGTETLNIPLPAPARVAFRVRDNGGQRLPAMLTFQPLSPEGEALRWTGTNYPELGDSRYDHGITRIVHDEDGVGTVDLPAGRYDITVSRGFEYGVARFRGVELRAAESFPLEATLNREMDTQGWLSGDLHLHTQASTDSALPYHERIRAAVAQGVEVTVSSDHDHLVDYEPFINELGLERFVRSQVGCETSPLEIGHINAWPLQYDNRKGPIHDPPPWSGETLFQIIQNILDRAAARDEAFVIQTNHPRDGFLGLFSQIGMTTYDLERNTSAMEWCNPAIVEVPCDFKTMEVMNGKHFEYLWTPSIREVAWFNDCVEDIFSARGTDLFSFERYDEGAVCGFLQNGPEGCEQAAARATEEGLDEAERARRLRLRDHCAWHERFRGEVARCESEALGLVDCKRVTLEASRNLMVRYMIERTPEEERAFLATTADNDLGCDYEAAMAGCEPQMSGEGLHTAGCGEECFCADCVCALMPECCLAEGEQNGEGLTGTGWSAACAALCASDCHGCGAQPCTDRLQPFDDWFAFLNAGWNVAAVANSDSHTVTDQIGLPRNFVESSTDRPYEADMDEFNRNLIASRVVASSGAFVEFTLSNSEGVVGHIGDHLAAPSGPVTAHVRVQTPSWYRIDRVEIYRNGQQERVFFVEPETTAEEAKRRIVDFEWSGELPRPDEDSWYVVFAYGVNDELPMAPVYKRKPFGSMLFSEIIALAADQLLSSLGGLVEAAEGLYPGAGELIEGMLGAIVLPESTDVLPLSLTNPIWVDYDGGGFWPVNARDDDGDGLPDLPAFCTVDCAPDAANPQSTCGKNQTCVAVDDPANALGGRCAIPMPPYCMGRQPVGGR